MRYVPDKAITLTPQGQTTNGGLSFELALCRECGQHYLVGKKVNGYFAEAVRDPSRDDFGVCFFCPLASDANQNETENRLETTTFNLCTCCGAFWPPGSRAPCEHGVHILVEEQYPADERSDQLVRCATCGYSGQDPVREVIHGGDGPHAMIATTLFERLDQEPKKVLAFADSRQEAAYFAWYLDDTYQTILRRSSLYQSLRHEWERNKESLSLYDLAEAHRKWCLKEGFIDEAATRREQRERAWTGVYREFLTHETRLSLAGVGLLRWSVMWPQSFQPAKILGQEPWVLSQPDALSLTFILLDRLRHDRAVELDTRDEISLDWNKLGLLGPQRFARLGPPRKQSHVASWNGPQGWRVQFLAKILKRKGHSHHIAVGIAEETLRHIWQDLVGFSESQRQDVQLLTRVDDGRQLNPVWWRVTPTTNKEGLYRCEVCNRIEAEAFQDICSRAGCSGSLLPVDATVVADNHYRLLYETNLPGNLSVEEHTAQLTTERGREVQRKFQEGHVNVLSCSTTFELGVDLGDLNTVFLRNVPPEPFNYVQRVGRAGRRAGSPGFAITYCRRGPHDLYNFSDPTRILSGRMKPPSIAIDNERVAERHLTAVALSDFFSHHAARFERVSNLLEDWAQPSLTGAVSMFLTSHRDRLERSLRSIFPRSLQISLGIDDGSWIDRITGAESRLALGELETASDVRRVGELEARARDAGQYRQAEWAQRRKKTIAEEDVLSFLSRKAIIPKYGFPVDVVELDTQRTGARQGFDVSLTRDLAIAIGEFAPTATLVAGKLEWEFMWAQEGARKGMGSQTLQSVSPP